jgi:hypothetical protein
MVSVFHFDSVFMVTIDLKPKMIEGILEVDQGGPEICNMPDEIWNYTILLMIMIN